MVMQHKRVFLAVLAAIVFLASGNSVGAHAMSNNEGADNMKIVDGKGAGGFVAESVGPARFVLVASCISAPGLGGGVEVDQGPLVNSPFVGHPTSCKNGMT